jgi:hypothetical protein
MSDDAVRDLCERVDKLLTMLERYFSTDVQAIDFEQFAIGAADMDAIKAPVYTSELLGPVPPRRS